MKKILKWLGIVIGAVFALIIIASIVIMIIVDKQMIEDQMEKALNRQVAIEDIDVGVFSVVSGIEVKGVQISNFKTAKQLEKLKDKPVPKSDLFVGLKAFVFKLKFMPLLSGNVELRELMLYEPVINAVRYSNGAFNFSDLMAPKKLSAEERAELKKKQEEEARKKAEEAKKPKEKSGPFTADDLPVSVVIGKVGLENGTVTFKDLKLKQTIQLYNLTTQVYDIAIDPKDLENKNQVKVKFNSGIKTIGTTSTGTVDSFDIVVSANGNVKPFDLKTRQVNPEVAMKVGSPRGKMTGLQIFDAMKSNETLEKYSGKLGFLKDTIDWKDGFVDVWYKGGVVKLSNGKIETRDYRMTFQGTANTNNKAVNMDIDLALDEQYNKSIEKGIQRNVDKGVKALGKNVQKYVKSDKITQSAMKKLVNDEGKVYLQYKVTGTYTSPKTKLVSPKLPTLQELIKDAAGDLGDVAKDAAKEAAKEATKKATDKAADKAAKKLKKLF